MCTTVRLHGLHHDIEVLYCVCSSVVLLHAIIKSREQQTERAIKEEQLRLRKIASLLAKEVRHFWDSMKKVLSLIAIL